MIVFKHKVKNEGNETVSGELNYTFKVTLSQASTIRLALEAYHDEIIEQAQAVIQAGNAVSAHLSTLISDTEVLLARI